MTLTLMQVESEAARAGQTWEEGAYAVKEKIAELFPYIRAEVVLRHGQTVIDIYGARAFRTPGVHTANSMLINEFDFRELINAEGMKTLSMESEAREAMREFAAKWAGGDPSDAAAYPGNPTTYIATPDEGVLQISLDTATNTLEFQRVDRSDAVVTGSKIRIATQEFIEMRRGVLGVPFEGLAGPVDELMGTILGTNAKGGHDVS